MAPKTRRNGAPAASLSTALDEPDVEDLVQPPRRVKAVKAENGATDTSSSDTGACIPRHDEAVHDFDMKALRDVRIHLLRWYDAHRRKLPWRGDPPPYLTTATHTKQTAAGAAPVVATKPKLGAMDAFVAVKVKSEGAAELQDGVAGNGDQHQEHLCSNAPEADGAASASDDEPPRRVSPYETWVSEIMLQQTRVDTVVDYFVRWTDKFPTVDALARGSEEDVNALWAGLGYYRRARMLHSGAKYVVENFGGELPSTIEQLLTIPGIGPYTAGAISSIAFGNREPLVDGNVIRVLARLRAVGADPKNKQLIKFSWKAAGELVEECERPGALNQALMELGATVCTVQNPECARCPVRSSCLAYEEAQAPATAKQLEINAARDCSLCDWSRHDEWRASLTEVTKYPLKAKKGDSKHEVICVSVLSYEDATASGSEVGSDNGKKRKAAKSDVPPTWRFLMAKRPDEGLLAGQWEFIHYKVADGEQIPAFAQRKTLMNAQLAKVLDSDAVASIKARGSSSVVERRDLGELTHIFSHVKHHMGVEHVHFGAEPALLSRFRSRATTADGSRGDSPAPTIRWMTTHEMTQLGITTGVKKILSLVATAPSGVAADSAAAAARRALSKPSRSRASSSAPGAPKRMKTLTSFFKK